MLASTGVVNSVVLAVSRQGPDASPRNMNRHTIGVAQILDFKGLESEVIFLVDMPKPGRSETLGSCHYVGMSRARAADHDLLLMRLSGVDSRS